MIPNKSLCSLAWSPACITLFLNSLSPSLNTGSQCEFRLAHLWSGLEVTGCHIYLQSSFSLLWWWQCEGLPHITHYTYHHQAEEMAQPHLSSTQHAHPCTEELDRIKPCRFFELSRVIMAVSRRRHDSVVEVVMNTIVSVIWWPYGQSRWINY